MKNLKVLDIYFRWQIGGMNKVLKEKQVTIFAPSNAVWDKMLPGTFKYLKSEKASKSITMFSKYSNT